MTYKQSHGVVDRTVSETTEWWLQTVRDAASGPS